MDLGAAFVAGAEAAQAVEPGEGVFDDVAGLSERRAAWRIAAGDDRADPVRSVPGARKASNPSSTRREACPRETTLWDGAPPRTPALPWNLGLVVGAVSPSGVDRYAG